MTLLIALRAMVSSEAPWYSGGYSIAPTPMIAPWPFISRGTEWLVPIVPGLVSEIVVPWKSSTVSLLSRVRRTMSSYAVQNAAKSIALGRLDAGHEELTGAVGLLDVDRQAEVDVGRRDQVGLAVDGVEADVHLRHRLERPDQRVADQVGERHLAAAGPGQMVVDDDAVVPQQLDRHRAHAGRGRHGERGVHVLRRARRGAAQDRVRRLVARRGLLDGLGLLRDRVGRALGRLGRLGLGPRLRHRGGGFAAFSSAARWSSAADPAPGPRRARARPLVEEGGERRLGRGGRQRWPSRSTYGGPMPGPDCRCPHQEARP